MNQFELLMDDMKDSLSLCFKNKKLFTPALFANIFFLIVMFVVIIGTIILAFSIVAAAMASPRIGFGMILIIIITVVIFTLIIGVGFLMIELGIIALIKALLDKQPITKDVFWTGAKHYFLKVFLTNIALSFIYFIGFIILLAPFIFYMFTVGMLTGGWGMMALTVIFQTLLGYWVIILVNDDGGTFESIMKNIRFGKKHFKILAFFTFIQMMIGTNFITQSGVGAVGLVTIFASYVLSTYFRMVYMKVYRRLNAE